MENHETLMKDSASDGAAKVIAKGDIITTVTTEKKAEEEKAEQEDAQMDPVVTAEPVVSTPLRHDTKVKPQSAVRAELNLDEGTSRELFLCYVISTTMSPDCQRNR